MGDAATLSVRGAKNVAVYRARLSAGPGKRRTRSPGRRHCCALCGSALWVDDPRWPEWVYPFASAIDTPLPKPPEDVLMMLDFAAPWAEMPTGKEHRHFAEYPEESIIGWHEKRKLVVP